MTSRRFSHDKVLPKLIKHIAEAEIFSQNKVRILIRTPVSTGRSCFLVTYEDKITKENAFRFFDHVELALVFAEEVQVVS